MSVVDERYDHFALPWLASTLFHNPEDCCELWLTDPAQFRTKNSRALRRLEAEFPQAIRLHKTPYDSRRIHAAAMRFLVTPTFDAEYFYISDCDIFVLDGGIGQTHAGRLKKTGCPFSNMLRRDKEGKPYKRLTGLHFGKTSTHFPLKLPARHPHPDEIFLYYLCQEKFGDLMRWGHLQFRPLHGLHTSPSRKLDMDGGKPGWNVTVPRVKQFVECWQLPLFSDLEPLMDRRYRAVIAAVRGRRKLHIEEGRSRDS